MAAAGAKSASARPAGVKKPRVGSAGTLPVDPVALSMTAPAEPADLPVAVVVPDLVADASPPLIDAPAPAPVDEITPSAAAAPEPTTSAAAAPEPTPSAAAAPEASKETSMAETYTTAADAMKNGADAMKASMHTTAESAMTQGKATFEQVASKSREAIESGMKNVDEIAGMARGNVEAMLASSRAAAQGIEAIAREVADFSRKAFDETTAAARAMTTVKTPNELMALQNDFAKTQFDAAVAEMSKLSETMVKLMGEVFEPMQARAAVATDKLKAMVTPGQ